MLYLSLKDLSHRLQVWEGPGEPLERLALCMLCRQSTPGCCLHLQALTSHRKLQDCTQQWLRSCCKAMMQASCKGTSSMQHTKRIATPGLGRLLGLNQFTLAYAYMACGAVSHVMQDMLLELSVCRAGDVGSSIISSIRA